MVISADQNTSLRAMSPFKLADLIDHTARGNIVSATTLVHGYYWKHTLKHSLNSILKQQTWEIPVIVTPHNSLNNCKGKTPDLKMCPTDEIVINKRGETACNYQNALHQSRD